MAIRAKRRFKNKSKMRLQADPKVVSFKTAVGWVGVAHVDEVITRIKFGYSTKQLLMAEFDSGELPSRELNEFERLMKDRLERYSGREQVEFDDLDIDESWMTPFQRSVTAACRDIPYGTTMSYGELAEAAGSPKAARAVGSVMSNNPFSLIVPCHRVVSSGMRIGGFSSPNGISQKLQLLRLEGAVDFS